MIDAQLREAAHFRNYSLCEELILKGGNVNSTDENHMSLLIQAIFDDDFTLIQLLHKYQVDFYQTWNRISPLNIAAKENKTEIAKFLIAVGCDVNVQDDVGCFPLLDAVLKGNEELIIHLLAKGANIDLQDHHGWSALMLAAYMGNDTWRILTRYGPNRNLKNEDGDTAFDIGKRRGNVVTSILR